MKVLFLFAAFFIVPLHAEEHEYGPPITVCLNKHTFPYINTTIPAIDIVNDAYKECADIVDKWNSDRKSLPNEMVIKQDQELRDMYIRMIEIRRKSSH